MVVADGIRVYSVVVRVVVLVEYVWSPVVQ